MRVAALADVHGNAPALEAVLAEVEREAPDLIVFCGDLTWGRCPRRRSRSSGRSDARFVRGNAERELLALFDELPAEASERERFLVERHDAAARDVRRRLPRGVVVESTGSGRPASATARRAATRSS